MGLSERRLRKIGMKVKCSYEKCGERRPHWSKPEEKRGRQEIEVPDDHDISKPYYCSITCACYSGAMNVRINRL